MLLKRIFIVLALLLLAGAAWRVRNAPWVQALMYPPDARAPQIQFDNGSARLPEPPASSTGVWFTPPGRMRKCVRGSTVSYTDQLCPPGMREQALAQGTVSVLPGQAGAAPAAAKAPPGADPQRPRTVRDVLAPPEANPLREQQMDRVIGR
jgi:hypothetical protein